MHQAQEIPVSGRSRAPAIGGMAGRNGLYRRPEAGHHGQQGQAHHHKGQWVS